MSSVLKVDRIQSDTGTVNVASKIEFPVGSAAAPSIFPTGDTNTGIFFPAADTIAFAEGGAEAMRIDSSGKVLIGASSSDLSGTSQALVIGSGGLAVQFAGATGTYLKVNPGDANGVVELVADARTGNYPAMTFKTSATERARITSGGAFLINGTSAPLENALMAITNGTIKWTVGPTSAGNFIVYNASSIGVYLVNGSNSWTGTSDERLKNITGTISNGLSKVNSLRAVEYTWKSDDTNKPQVGLIAQDVKEVLPQVVDENASGFLGIRYTDTIPLLVAAIQELKAINDAQAIRIETLEAKVSALESQ